MDEYIILTDDTLAQVKEKTGWHLSSLVDLIVKGHRLGGRFAIFCANNKWQRVFIYHRYHEKEFMTNLKEALRL